MHPRDAWRPEQYERFQSERAQPFHDLLGLVKPQPAMRILDLGCGTGELTASLLERFENCSILGIDRSEAMIEQARLRGSDRLEFRHGDLDDVQGFGQWDLILSNAVLHWVADQRALLRRILGTMRPGAQLALQMPRNDDHVGHRTCQQLASEPSWAASLGGFVHRNSTMPPEGYLSLLREYGCDPASTCFERVYRHELRSSRDVVEWLKGSLLTAYVSRLPPELGAAFVAQYESRLLHALGDQRPYFYEYRRVLLWARTSG